MYVLVQHEVFDPASFWSIPDPTRIAPDVKLHHTFPTKDGTRAVCLWEAASVARVRDFLEPHVGRFSHNEYFEVENASGVSMPSGIPRAEPTTA